MVIIVTHIQSFGRFVGFVTKIRENPNEKDAIHTIAIAMEQRFSVTI